MTCPPEIAEVLVEILQIGLLRIRTLGYQGDPQRCVHESDHIHNLPALLIDYTPELLEFYWRTERPLLIRQTSHAECRVFESAWERLQPLVEHALSKTRGVGLDAQSAAASAAPATVE
jgi:hypothetical protein